MINVLFEDVESEIIDDKLQQGEQGLNFLIDVSSSLTDREYTKLYNLIKFCTDSVTKENYFAFSIEAFADERNVFESKYRVSVDCVRKLLLKMLADEVREKPQKRYLVVGKLNEYIEKYRNIREEN